ncbi:MAG: alpha/beta hydrolase, partial [Candidatus Omnitrophota bacterium]
AYLRYFEKKSIYYPTRIIEYTPKAVGLQYEDIYFSTKDGLRLNGWFIPAKDAKITILFSHGNAGNISHRVRIAKVLNTLGANLFIYDYRGYGKSQGRPSEKGFYIDARSAYDYLRGRGDVDKKKIVIYGKSIGANVSIYLASKVEAAALISESGFSSAADMGERIFPFLPVKWLLTIKYDAVSKIENISIPKFIIHSKDDEIVPYDLGKKLYEAAPEPKEFYEMRGGHNEAVFIDTDEFVSRIDDFLSRHVK